MGKKRKQRNAPAPGRPAQRPSKPKPPGSPRKPAAGSSPAKKPPVALLCLLLAACVLPVYLQTASFDFINYDDNQYVTDNAHVNTGLSAENVRWAFTSVHSSNWHPLTWISHQADVSLFGMDPGAHHLVNVAFHLANSLLLFLFLVRATREAGPSLFVAALFALHPLHVESVAWVAERKDVLSTFFGFLTLLTYLAYIRRPGALRLAGTLACYTLSLLAKPMLVTLPALLLLLDVWPLGRLKPFSAASWKRPLIEKAPFAALAAAMSAAAYRAQETGQAVSTLDVLPLGARMGNAVVSYARYLADAVWPSGLAPFYPHPGTGIHAGAVLGAALLAAALSLGALWTFRSRPYITVGWFWYLGTLVPVIGLVQIGAQSHADRYTYVPLVGVFIAAAWGLSDLWAARRLPSLVLRAAALVVAAALGALAFSQTALWKDSVSLFTHTLAVTERNALAHKNLGVALANAGDQEGALAQYRLGLAIDGEDADLQYDAANALSELGRKEEAVKAYRKAASLDPGHVLARYNLGNTLARLGRYGEAEEAYRRALALDPNHEGSLVNLGNTLALSGSPEEAIRCFTDAMERTGPTDDLLINLGNTHASIGEFDAAAEYFSQACELRPGDADLRCSLGICLLQGNRLSEARGAIEKALRLAPGHERARRAMGTLDERMEGKDPSGEQNRPRAVR